jgi:alkylmercury lyase
MSTHYVDQTTDLISRVEGQQLLPHAIRLLAEGRPVTLEQLAAAAGWSVKDVEAKLAAQTSAERDDQGRLLGLALTLRPTSHRITVDGRTLFAWCATDTLIIPIILGRPAIVESTCPQTGAAIRIELTPEAVKRIDPPDAVMSAVRPRGELANVRAQTCDHGHFFSSSAATAAWTRAHPTATSTQSSRPSSSTARSSSSLAGRAGDTTARRNRWSTTRHQHSGRHAQTCPPGL